MPSRAFVFIDDRLNDLHVNWVVADPRDLCCDARPMNELLGIAGEASTRGDPLGLVISHGRVLREKAARVFSTKAVQCSPPFNPS